MEEKYYHTKESVDEYIKLAAEVNGAELIQKLKIHLPANSSLLELGSGPGTDWNILKQNYEVVGSDLSQEFLDHLTKSNPNGTFIELDAVALDTNQKFDGIYSNKVLHHLNDEELQASIQRQAEILNSKGIICHSFWKGEGSEKFKGMFVNYHSEDDLRSYFEGLFDILVLESYQEFDEGDSILFVGIKR